MDKMCPVMPTNLPPVARATDRSGSQIQNFWLDATIPLIFLQEKAEDQQWDPDFTANNG